mgnify:FL=1
METSFKMAIIRPNGEIDVLIRKNLKEMQGFVGGYLEEVPTTFNLGALDQTALRIPHLAHPGVVAKEGIRFEAIDGKFYKPVVYADEEGLMKKLPFNTLGSMMCGRELVGNILVIEINPEDDSGYSCTD